MASSTGPSASWKSSPGISCISRRGPSLASTRGVGWPASVSSNRPSWAKNGGTTFSHSVPALEGRRQRLDRFQVRICSGRPAAAMPLAAIAACAQARSAAGPPGRA